MNPHLVPPTDEQFEGIIGLFPKWQQRELRRQRYGDAYAEPLTRGERWGIWFPVGFIIALEIAAVVGLVRWLLR